MQQDNNHIEDKFRQLENQQLPDLSNMDKHWSDMQRMLGTTVAQKDNQSKSFIKLNIRKLFIAASIVSVLFAAFMIYKNRHTEKTNNESAQVATPKAEEKTNVIAGNQTVTDTKQISPKTVSAQPGNRKEPEMAATNQPEPTITKDIIDTDAGLDAAASRAKIASFYTSIQKPIQEFDVNAEEGGSITCSEGTIINIPPLAFVDENGRVVSGTVQVMVEEFYKYSDMVAANLTTMSDNKQLATGGMVKITAVSNGGNLNLRKSKGLGLVMPTPSYDAAMKLFTAETEAGTKTGSAMYAGYAMQDRNINWNLSGQQNVLPAFDGKTNFPDDLNQPYNLIKTSKKKIAKFALSKKSPYTVKQMEKILKEKYGNEYDVIKVKAEGDAGGGSTFFYRGKMDKENVIGDSIRLTLDQALRSTRYIERKDSAYYADKIKADSMRYVNEYSKLQKAYSFVVKKLGWINCDKYCNHTNKTNFVINLPPDVKADRFVSQVVFTSIRSVMPGRVVNNQINFSDIPSDMGVYLVGLGERNGKIVSFMQKLKVGKSEVSINDLQETTPEAFRKKITELDMN